MQPPSKPASSAAIMGPPTTQVSKSNSVTPTPSATALSSGSSIPNPTNINTHLMATKKEDTITSPPQSIQDKIVFIFNNLSQINLQKKCDELKGIVGNEYWPWISQYLVKKRACIEYNFHALYSNFLDVLKVPDVNRMVTKETLKNIKVLLRSDKVQTSSFDRSLLNNLGHWMGMMTLGRNKPILHIDLDLKGILVEAYHKGQQRLLCIVPFIVKILESCTNSKIFKPPNPWTISIMNVLAEMHQEPDLKLNLKFEIEVLCKRLYIEISQLKPSNILKDPENLRKIKYQSKKTTASTNSHISTIPTYAFSEAESISVAGQSTTTPLVAQDNSTPSAPEPRFSYMNIQISGNEASQTHITVSPSILLFQSQPHLKGLVKTSVERAVQECITPIVVRSVKIALRTCEQIIRKDFALDADEVRLRSASHCMVRNLTAGMAMITCRDELLASIISQMKVALQTALISATAQQKEMIDQASNIIAHDNVELACAFIQKTAIENSILEIDKRLAIEFELRKTARQEGRRYCDATALTYQAERMPPQIRLNVGDISPSEMTVYEEYASNIPGFVPLSDRDSQVFVPKVAAPIEPLPQPSTPFQVYQEPLSYNDMAAVYEKLIHDAEQFVQGTYGQSVYSRMNSSLVMLSECLLFSMLNRDMAVAVIQKCVEGVQKCSLHSDTDPAITKFKKIMITILKFLQDPRVYGQQWINKHITRYLCDFRDELRFNEVAIETLIRSGLVITPQFDVALAQCIKRDPNHRVLNLAMVLITKLLIEDRSNLVTKNDFFNTIDMLTKINTDTRQPPEALTKILDMLRQHHDQSAFLSDRSSAGSIVHIDNGILQVSPPNCEDPPGLMGKTDDLIREWINIYNTQPTGSGSAEAINMFVHQMNLQGILKTNLIPRFLNLSTQLCVESAYINLSHQTLTDNNLISKLFNTLDAFVRLVVLLFKHSGDSNDAMTKTRMLIEVLVIVEQCLVQDHERRGVDFQQFPYHRILMMLFLELNAPEPGLETMNCHVLIAYSHALHNVRPSKAAGFCYAWLELISHRVFMARMLSTNPHENRWPMYAQLLNDVFKYLSPFLRHVELAKSVTMLYEGTLRMLLVLLHDFPEFLCEYHHEFCDVIPPNCIQLRNLILSAFPRSMRLPNPFTTNLDDILQEIPDDHRVDTNFASMITPLTFKNELDSYLKLRTSVTFLSELRSNLQVLNEPDMRYNIPLMNALVLYVGTQAIAYIRGKSISTNMTTIAHTAHMDIFQHLAVDLDTEGRYLFLNSIANQLRYSNSHTHYFSCTLLYLFAEANIEAIQEQIARVLLERLIVNKPHPWGLLITFIELVKNPNYKFWDREFVHCDPEIKKLVESVAGPCFVQKTAVQADAVLPE